MDDWLEDAAAMDGFFNVTAADGDARRFAKRLRSRDWCRRSRWITPSPEDVVAGLEECRDIHVRGRLMNSCICGYGRYYRNGATNKTFFYVEVPKAGTSSIKEAFRPYKVEEPSWGIIAVEEKDAEGIEAFAFVRHPVSRFLSGYSTVINRSERRFCTAELAFLFEDEEPQRFNRFVDLFVGHGEATEEWNMGWCVMQHVFSQTWFLNLWPGKVSLFHVESFDRDFGALRDLTQLPAALPRQHLNPNEGSINRSLLAQQHGALQKLHDYFKDEMEALSYEPLPGYSR